MDICDEEIFKFCHAMKNSAVKFIITGSLATNLKGYQR